MACCLCIVVDCDARNWGELISKTCAEDSEIERKHSFRSLIGAVTCYANAHKMLRPDNSVVLVATASTITNPTIFTSLYTSEPDMTLSMKEALTETLKGSALNPDAPPSSFTRALAAAFCHLNGFKKKHSLAHGRVMLINFGSELIGEHNALMNLFFAAHKQEIVIDVANLGNSSPILQQASDITAGICMDVTKPKYLLQYMMTLALGRQPSVYKIFPQVTADSVDYRATCFCHGKSVGIGWVCSVCLAVQCRFNAFCCSCETHFDLVGMPHRMHLSPEDEAKLQQLAKENLYKNN